MSSPNTPEPDDSQEEDSDDYGKFEEQFSRAVYLVKFGGYDSFAIKPHKLCYTYDKSVEVKLEYGGVNFADLYTRKGLMNRSLPFIMGIEAAGVINHVPARLKDELKVGQNVVVYDFNGGMYSERVLVPLRNVFPLPDGMTCKEGATVFVNYLTAYLSIIDVGNLKPNEKVLIMSCAGGVGTAAVQLARTIENVTIFGVASVKKEKFAKSKGVDIFFSNETIDLQLLRSEKFDLILCNQSGQTFTYMQSLLKPLGRIILLGANNLITDGHGSKIWNFFNSWWAPKDVDMGEAVINCRTICGLHLGTLAFKERKKILEMLHKIYKLMEEKKITPVIDSVHPMSDIITATRCLAERRNKGKVLISMLDKRS